MTRPVPAMLNLPGVPTRLRRQPCPGCGQMVPLPCVYCATMTAIAAGTVRKRRDYPQRLELDLGPDEQAAYDDFWAGRLSPAMVED